jgi:hypothetical protein
MHHTLFPYLRFRGLFVAVVVSVGTPRLRRVFFTNVSDSLFDEELDPKQGFPGMKPGLEIV